MNTVTFLDWTLLVDKETTQDTYSRTANGSAESCNCNDCKRYLGLIEKVYPKEIIELFKQLGIDYRKDSEISSIGLDNGFVEYSGWFHFKGKFIGQSCIEKLATNSFTLHLIEITNEFSIGFHYSNTLSFFKPDEQLVQVEFNIKVKA
ncbi:MAG: hypothetical protein H6551_03380 [Chitinophagales bacterium]|nr:hypothetical protein [Chitinophagaceae bacterium]MCB9064167.1 hypothetical protein [Chitinophagales bacterium]